MTSVVLSSILLKMVITVMLLVLMAMIIDLGSGLYKAKQRGELRSSEALKRTLTKFISYEGGLVIAAMVDMLINMAHFFELFGINALSNIPVVTILVGIFLLIVEFMSVREKADEKTKKQQADTASVLAKLLTKEDVKELIETIKNNNISNNEANETVD
jgi:phage-related holin